MANRTKYPQGCGVYAIEHIESGRRYVGSSQKMENRFTRHVSMLRTGKHHSPHLQAAWDKYGEEAFSFLCITQCDSVDELIAAEQLEIEMNDATTDGFNCAKVAGSPMRGRKQSEETKAKMRESHKARKPISEETRERMRQASIEREAKKKAEGHVVSEETRKKISEKGKGRKFSQDVREKISKANKGQQLTEEQRRKQIAALTGRKLSEDHRKAISDGNYRRWAMVKDQENRISQ